MIVSEHTIFEATDCWHDTLTVKAWSDGDFTAYVNGGEAVILSPKDAKRLRKALKRALGVER